MKRKVVYRAILGALLILIFANVKIKDKSELQQGFNK